MKKLLIRSFVICTVLTLAGCSNAQDISQKNQIVEEQISESDKIIIQKYKTLINNIDSTRTPESKEKLKNFLKESSKIKNQNEKDKIEMNIYMALEMYKEAYELNKRQLEEIPSQSNLFKHCELMQILEYPQNDLQNCQRRIAESIKEELNKISKDDQAYAYAEWGYLLAMYKSGHNEYKDKMEKFIKSTTDETMKFQFQSSYEMAIERSN
ncbi:hypothetical protein MOW14_14310 (plasmid) [Acinetobacter indicus]|uniref:hypothetical protein n=1 Tax=Acinetobacter indicus TaxID=756892 RepID=UPI000CEB7346|nr:hypothetical protein [Acinetobacter indicus]AVH13770.1 hypothetical protein CTZ23_05415 [Acinetobacter indicus]UNW11035.1 hypothetical protein MOW14_14310 [Acinetobacter indicus]